MQVPYKSLSYPIITAIVILLLVGGCNLLDTSDSTDPINWKRGEIIPPPSGNRLSEQQKTEYRKDAERLAVRRINELDSTRTDVPRTLVDLLYNGLLQIVNSQHREAAEVRSLKIHAFRPYHPREIMIVSYHMAPWMDAWKEGHTETGDPFIDSIIHRFEFTLKEFNQFTFGSDTVKQVLAILRSNRLINGYAVGRLFERHEDIRSAGPEGVLGGGSNIQIQFRDFSLRFTFNYGWGDCPSGCIYRHRWKFSVFRNGSIVFEGESGKDLPQHRRH